MKNFLRKLKIKISNLFIVEEDIKSSKNRWQSLAEKESKYVVWTQNGKNINEEDFRKSGKNDYFYVVGDDAILQEKLKLTKKNTALEIGCGVGRISEFLADDFNNVYGVDISGHMIEQAKKRLPEEKFHFLEGDGMSLPIKSESIDFIMSHAVFQHMPSRKVIESNFKEAFRVLKSGGLFKVQLRATETSKKNWFYGASYNQKEAEKMCLKVGFSTVYNKVVDRSDYKKILYVLLEKPF